MSAIPSEVAQSYGDLPNSWRLEKLKFSARVRNSNVDKKTEDGEEPVRLCNYTDVYYNDRITPDMDFMEATASESEIERFTLKQGQVIITKDSEGWDDIGIPTYVTEDMPGVLCGYHLSVLEPDSENLDGAFLSWLCRADPLNDQFKLGSNGVTRYGLGQYPLKSSYIPLPDLDTQRRIAGYLDDKTARIDALIAKKRALLDRLAEKRQALITHAVTRGLNPDAPLKDSGIDWLGKVPAHWEVKKLYRFTDPQRPIRYGIVLPGPNFPDGVPIIKGGDVKSDRLTLDQLNRTDPEIEAGYARSRMKAGEIVFSIRGSYGDVEIVPDELDGCNLTQDTARVSPGEGIETHWLLYVLKSHVTRLHLEARALGSTITGVNIFDLRRVPLPVPPKDEQEEIGRFLAGGTAHLDETAAKCALSIEKLQEYRAALVTAAVTGKIKALLTEDAPKPAKKEAPAAFKRSVLAAYIADTLCDHPTFGRVKFQKLLHLSEGYANANEVAGDYKRDAAGPFDTRMMQSVHSQIKKQGWIVTAKRDGDAGTLYRRGVKVEGYKTYFDRYFGDRKDDIDYLLALFKTATTQQAEIVSTTFAAWNDLLLEGKTPSDDEIVELILNDWHDSKRKIAPEQWHKALPWMREKGLIPRGMGEHTKKKS